VVHRDVSPQNILISMRGHVRLADFGVAKSRGQLHRPTETGEVKGKLSYMAPEQVTSKNIDRRADVFALGCVLYEAVLGARPFHGPDALATMYKILEEELPRPSTIDPEVPPRLEQVLCKALEKDPNARYQTAEEFRDDLLDFVASSGRFVADKHVGEVVAAALGPELTVRNQAIISAAEQLRRGETDPRKLQTPSASSPTQTLTPEGGVERSVTVQQQTRAATSPLAYALTAAVVVLGAVGAWFALTRPTPAVPAAVVSDTAPASALPEAPTPVALATALALNTAPSPVLSAPLSASAAAPATRAPVTARPSSRGPARPVEQPTPLATAKDGDTSPGAKPGGKKPRPIDRENPFGAPSE
jgi:eukaryotic-like serine/threonine-protein kinase